MQIVPSTDDRLGHQTYVIQVPKDQIYRVPPPENAQIAEKYRNPDNSDSKKRRTQGLLWCGSIMFFIVFLITTVTCVNKYTLSPKLPTFSIRGINYVKIAPKKNGFKVSVQTTNPNSNNDIVFKDGNVTLLYQEEEIGKGKFKLPSGGKQKRGKSDIVVVTLNSIDQEDLPEELLTRKASKKKGKKREEGLMLEMNMKTQVKLITWRWTKSVNIKVECEVEVDSLGKGSSILSQSCVIDDSRR